MGWWIVYLSVKVSTECLVTAICFKQYLYVPVRHCSSFSTPCFFNQYKLLLHVLEIWIQWFWVTCEMYTPCKYSAPSELHHCMSQLATLRDDLWHLDLCPFLNAFLVTWSLILHSISPPNAQLHITSITAWSTNAKSIQHCHHFLKATNSWELSK